MPALLSLAESLGEDGLAGSIFDAFAEGTRLPTPAPSLASLTAHTQRLSEHQHVLTGSERISLCALTHQLQGLLLRHLCKFLTGRRLKGILLKAILHEQSCHMHVTQLCSSCFCC